VPVLTEPTHGKVVARLYNRLHIGFATRQLWRLGIKFSLIAIEPIAPLSTFLFKAVRLRALQDAPHAFGSTYAKEFQLTDSDWIKRVERWNGESGAGFLAMDDDTACGIAASFLDQNDTTRALLISMWTAPTHRQRGIGRLLVNGVLNWAQVVLE
jgi:GNAT superfamily N-acetyltransferase